MREPGALISTQEAAMVRHFEPWYRHNGWSFQIQVVRACTDTRVTPRRAWGV